MPHRLSLPGFLLALAPACGEPPAGEPLSLVPAQSLTFDLDLEIPSFAADPALDVIVSWEAATAGMLSRPALPVAQVQFTGFQELDETGVLDALEDGTLGQSEVRIAFLCTPRASACAFSEFDVFGHDFRVSEAFGDGGGAWLLTRWGAGSAGVQGLEFLRPDPGSGTGSVRCGAPPSRVRLANVAVASESLRVVAGKDVVFDGSSLEVDARGWPLEPRRVDAATLLHLDASPDDVPSVLEDHGFEDAWAVRGDVGANGRVSLSALGRPAGIDLDGTWLLALWTSSSWVPAPVFLAVLVPEA